MADRDDEKTGKLIAPRPPRAEYRCAEIGDVVAEVLRQLKPAEMNAPTFGEFADRFIREYAIANRQKPRGVDSKRSHLEHHILPRFGDLPMNLVADEDIQKLKADFADYSPKTTNNVLSTLNTMLKVAVRWKVLKRLPVTIESLPVPPPPFSFYEFEQYAQLVRANEFLDDVRLCAVILLGGDAGLRLGEMAALEFQHVDHRRDVMTVCQSESQGILTAPKGGRSRTVPMTQKLWAALQRLRLAHNGEGRILRRDDESNVSAQVLRTWIARAQKNARLPERGALHVLRHTFCSHLAMRNAPMLAIKELAGHTSIRTTMRYMHLAPSEATRAIKLLNERPYGSPTPTAGEGLENYVPDGIRTRVENSPVSENHVSQKSSSYQTRRSRVKRKASRRDEPSSLAWLWTAIDEASRDGGDR